MSSNSVFNRSRDKQIGFPLRGRPILLITRMTTDRIGLLSVLLPLHNVMYIYNSLKSFQIDWLFLTNMYKYTFSRSTKCNVLCSKGDMPSAFSPVFFRAGSSAVVQMSCSLGLGLFLSKLYEEHFRHVLSWYSDLHQACFRKYNSGARCLHRLLSQPCRIHWFQWQLKISSLTVVFFAWIRGISILTTRACHLSNI